MSISYNISLWWWQFRRTNAGKFVNALAWGATLYALGWLVWHIEISSAEYEHVGVLAEMYDSARDEAKIAFEDGKINLAEFSRIEAAADRDIAVRVKEQIDAY